MKQIYLNFFMAIKVQVLIPFLRFAPFFFSFFNILLLPPPPSLLCLFLFLLIIFLFHLVTLFFSFSFSFAFFFLLFVFLLLFYLLLFFFFFFLSFLVWSRQYWLSFHPFQSFYNQRVFISLQMDKLLSYEIFVSLSALVGTFCFSRIIWRVQNFNRNWHTRPLESSYKSLSFHSQQNKN